MTTTEINQTLSVLGPAESEPVAFDEACEHMKLDTTEDRELVVSLVAAATEFCQRFTLRQFVTATLRMGLDRFPPNDCAVHLLRPPVQSVTEVSYLDTDGNRVVLDSADYLVDLDANPAVVVPAYGSTWPGARIERGSVRFDYVAGFGPPEDVPDGLKTAIKMLAATWYENREAVITGQAASEVPMSVESILWQWRMVEFR